MSYEKAMKHHRNIRKCKKQRGMYLGFAVSDEPWINPRRDPETALVIEIREGFKYRRPGDDQETFRWCMRNAVRRLREIRRAREKTPGSPSCGLSKASLPATI